MIEQRSKGHGGVRLAGGGREWTENASSMCVEEPCLVYERISTLVPSKYFLNKYFLNETNE